MSRLFEKPLNLFFFITILLLYVTFISIDVLSIGSRELAHWLKFSCVVLCFVWVMYHRLTSTNRQDSHFVFIALFFTVIADINLLLLDKQIIGVLVFWIVQLTYIGRFNSKLSKRGIVLGVLICIIAFILSSHTLYIIASYYAILILLATILTFKSKLPPFNKKCASLGMILFVLCDLHVALYQLIPRTNFYYTIASNLMWFFYVPAQVMLVSSAFYTGLYFKKS